MNEKECREKRSTPSKQQRSNSKGSGDSGKENLIDQRNEKFKAQFSAHNNEQS